MKELTVCFCVCLMLSALPNVYAQIFWLDGWSYRAAFTVTSNMDNFQGNVTVTIPATFLDSVRITENDGVTLIPVWNESTTIIWGRFPTANETYYLYWGNSGASAVWNSSLVFERVISSGIVLALPCDEGVGVPLDYSANNYAVTVNGATWTTGGKWDDDCLNFDGNDNLTVADALPLDLIGNGSVVTWFSNTNDADQLRMFNKKSVWNSADGYAIKLHTAGFTDVGRMGSSTTELTVDCVTAWDGTLHHIAVLFSGTNSTVIFNNTDKGDGAIAAIADSAVSLEIGGGLGTYITGKMQGIYLFNYSLTVAEVSDLYNHYVQCSGNYPGNLFLREWWTGTVSSLGAVESMVSGEEALGFAAIAFMFACVGLALFFLNRRR